MKHAAMRQVPALTYAQRRAVRARLRAVGRYQKALGHPLSATQRAKAAARLRRLALSLLERLDTERLDT